MSEDRRCNSCGGTLVRGLEAVRDPQSLEPFDIQSCWSCGLGHTTPIPEDLGAYYGDVYYGKRHSFTDRYCLARRTRVLDRSTRATGGSRKGSLLDIGCGDGNFLAAAIANGWHGVGTDIGRAAENAKRAGLDVYGSLEEVR